MSGVRGLVSRLLLYRCRGHCLTRYIVHRCRRLSLRMSRRCGMDLGIGLIYPVLCIRLAAGYTYNGIIPCNPTLVVCPLIVSVPIASYGLH